MSKNQSQYNSTKNLKITYYLGAGASYNALPIWHKQGNSMIEVSNQIFDRLKSINLKDNSRTAILFKNQILTNFAKKLKKFGEFAVEYGSIDIYARRLYLLKDLKQLNELKYCLSVYFDLWEKFLFLGQKINKNDSYQKIDKRYYSLLSVLLEKNDNLPKLSDSISIITWNYDLQMEMAYASFLPKGYNSLETINSGLKFKDNIYNNERLNIIHLNGYRGEFKYENKTYPNVEDKYSDTIEDYLLGILENYNQFKRSGPDYKDCIKYAWESNSKSINRAKKIMEETDILIIIGYSFPSFNRQIDSQLITEFEKKSSYKKIVYQDPNINSDLVNSIFSRPEEVELKSDINTRQFYIPHEFLFPTEGTEISFGVV